MLIRPAAALKWATVLGLLEIMFIVCAVTAKPTKMALAPSFLAKASGDLIWQLSIGSMGTPSACPVTMPNRNTPPGENPSPSHYGNGTLWTALWLDGSVEFRPGGPGFVLSDGSLKMKFPWWRGVPGNLSIQGKRLDAPAPPLRAEIPKGYGNTGFQTTYLIFPTEGCWEVTGKVGEASLTFVTRVVNLRKRK